MNQPRLLFALLIAAIVVAGGCASIDPGAHADDIAQQAGFRRETVPTQEFLLTAFSRIDGNGEILDVYIEGDGFAWRDRATPSTDPTPHEAMGLRLAAADPSPNVVYLARPCQFTPHAMDPHCATRYWTDKRFAPEVITSIAEALDVFAARLPQAKINLIGYSGGGAVAVLLAAQRPGSIASIRTIGGNLDHGAVNRLHKVSEMPDSLNPIDVAGAVTAIPQTHFSGGEDAIVPPAIATRFRQASGGECVKAVVVPGMTHTGNWAAIWPRLLASAPVCDGTPAVAGQ
jgi:dienelactone hydrolase